LAFFKSLSQKESTLFAGEIFRKEIAEKSPPCGRVRARRRLLDDEVVESDKRDGKKVVKKEMMTATHPHLILLLLLFSKYVQRAVFTHCSNFPDFCQFASFWSLNDAAGIISGG
jgi:hypothetical protein